MPPDFSAHRSGNGVLTQLVSFHQRILIDTGNGRAIKLTSDHSRLSAHERKAFLSTPVIPCEVGGLEAINLPPSTHRPLSTRLSVFLRDCSVLVVNVRWETHQRSISILLRLENGLIKVIVVWDTTEQTSYWIDAVVMLMVVYFVVFLWQGNVEPRVEGVELC